MEAVGKTFDSAEAFSMAQSLLVPSLAGVVVGMVVGGALMMVRLGLCSAQSRLRPKQSTLTLESERGQMPSPMPDAVSTAHAQGRRPGMTVGAGRIWV